MTQEQIPGRLYHGLTIDQFLDHWSAGDVRGFSRFPPDSDGEGKGTYLTDSFDYAIENGHGLERTGGDIFADRSHQHHKTRVIAEFFGVREEEKLVPLWLPHQLFYFGDIPISYISRVHIDQVDDAVRTQDIQRLIKASIPEQMIVLYDPFQNLALGSERK